VSNFPKTWAIHLLQDTAAFIAVGLLVATVIVWGAIIYTALS
jgi:hypothetical protein